jgi:hypothetical protein
MHQPDWTLALPNDQDGVAAANRNNLLQGKKFTHPVSFSTSGY